VAGLVRRFLDCSATRQHDERLRLRHAQMTECFQAFILCLLRHCAGVEKHDIRFTAKGNTFKTSVLKLTDPIRPLGLIETASKYFKGKRHKESEKYKMESEK
jgi:hypothetical protein